jgi:hypothetical protein
MKTCTRRSGDAPAQQHELKQCRYIFPLAFVIFELTPCFINLM